MSSTNGSTQAYGGASFEPMTYDLDTIEPDAYPGEYEGKLNDGELKISKKGQPMIQIEWELASTPSDDANCQKSVGSTLRDWIVLANDKSGNRGKLKLRTLREKFGIDVDMSTLSPEVVAEFIAQARGQTMPIFVAASTDRDGNPQTNVNYTAPRSAGMAPMGGEEEEPEAPAAPAASKKAPAKKPAAAPAKKTTARR
jgi:hypothetical protein